jgi:hypothetical protein
LLVVLSSFYWTFYLINLRDNSQYLLQPFTEYFPQADIHEMLSPDILHQLIKGAFKDHIVTWVHDYIKAQHPENEANKILDDIDEQYVRSTDISQEYNLHIQFYSIALAPPFAGLRRFPEGRRFKQWTGDDSKALMKVGLIKLSSNING